jgi:hypothetical protein
MMYSILSNPFFFSLEKYSVAFYLGLYGNVILW